MSDERVKYNSAYVEDSEVKMIWSCLVVAVKLVWQAMRVCGNGLKYRM